MTRYHFQLLNVFAETTFGGNQLCVFEDARGLSDDTMQALARQFNLSETSFILPSEDADARVRIFTPGTEMPFAGHPTLGTAQVVHALQTSSRAAPADATIRLEMQAGVIPVTFDNGVWTLTAPTSSRALSRSPDIDPALIAAIFGLAADDLLSTPLWLDTGSDQLLIPLKSVDAVRRAVPAGNLLAQWPQNSLGRRVAYLFAFNRNDNNHVEARYFFGMPNGGAGEDAATGSACANLGGWLIATGEQLPRRIEVDQGSAISRPSRLLLEVSAQNKITVGGRVIAFGRGSVDI